jgi:hypothetical protein
MQAKMREYDRGEMQRAGLVAQRAHLAASA